MIQLSDQNKDFKEAKKIARILIKRDDINDVQFGFKYVEGKRTDQLAIRVNVREKRAKKEISRKDVLPKTIDSFPTDVVTIKAKPHFVNVSPSTKLRPLIGGLQIQSDLFGDNDAWGTLGQVFSSNGILSGITNYHVVFDEKPEDEALNLVGGIDILQPQRTFMGTPIGTPGSYFSARLDYCFINILAGISNTRDQSIDMVPGTLQGYKNGNFIGTKVEKVGAATGFTEGIVVARSCIDTANLVISSGSPDNLISDHGDSGAIWYTRENNKMTIVGLNWGGDTVENLAYAKVFSAISASINNKIRNH